MPYNKHQASLSYVNQSPPTKKSNKGIKQKEQLSLHSAVSREPLYHEKQHVVTSFRLIEVYLCQYIRK